MNVKENIARHIREIHFGNNWTDSSMQEVLEDITWQEATTTVAPCNSIALLVFHMNFYLNVVHNRVLRTPNKMKHEDSLIAPSVSSENDWQTLQNKTWEDAEAFAKCIEQLPESQLWEEISPERGNFYKNIHGVVEHNHYHLGQIVVLKKLIRGGF